MKMIGTNVLIAETSKEETTAGTLAFPSASDYLVLKDFPSFEQSPNNTTIQDIKASRTTTDKTFNYFNYGSFSGLNISARPSGTAGTAPTASEKTLLKAALGKVTDSSTTGVSAVSISGITQASPAVITVTDANHGFKAGHKITAANCTETDFNISYVVASVSGVNITTETDASGFGGAATDGDITLAMTSFTLDKELPYFSTWMLTETGAAASGGGVLEAASGCQINSFSCSLAKDGEVQYSFGGDFSRLYYGGTGTLSATAADSATTLTFDSASYDVDELFFVGQKVNIIDPAGTVTLDAPVSVTAVNSTGNTLTVDALSVTSGPLPVGSIVKPYLPTGTISGSILSQRTAKAYLGTADTGYGQASGDLFTSGNQILANSASVDLSQNLQKPVETEMDGNEYPSAAFIAENRELTGSLDHVFRIDDQKYYQSIKTTPRRALGYSVGETAGSIIDFYLPKVFVDVPGNSQSEGARVQNFPFEAIEPAAGEEEEFMIVYR